MEIGDKSYRTFVKETLIKVDSGHKGTSDAELWCILCCYPNKLLNKSFELPIIVDTITPK